MSEKNEVGSSSGTRLFTNEPQYEIDQQTGLYVVKQWQGAYSMSDETKNEVKDVSPTGKPVVPQWAVVALTVAVIALPAIALIPGPQQPVVAIVAGVVGAIGAAFGIVSPGLRVQSKGQQK